jgi:sodium/hydrogen exchanger 3
MRLVQGAALLALLLACACLASAETQTPKSGEPIPLTFSVHEMENESESRVFAWTFLMLVTVLIIALIQGYTISVLHCEFFSEAAGAIILGMLIGIAVKYIGGFERFTELVQFNQEFFFLVLLPPIIFESGYNMQKGHFFYNFGGIAVFALAGTTISMFVIALLLWLFSAVFKWTKYTMSGLDAFFFGALLSATDPVTVLAIFKELGVHPDLYANVFGESVLNDAVAIVLFDTVKTFFTNAITFGSIVFAVLDFGRIFLGSIVVAIIVGVIAALTFKWTDLYKYPRTEAVLIILFAYQAYLMAESLKLSGIVAILFAGIVMAHYAYKNLSGEAQHASRSIFEALAFLFETFIFIYLGMALFTFKHAWDPVLIILLLPILLISRAVNVFPLSFAVNMQRKAHHKIPMNQQLMLWFGGLRGAMAFALSIAVPTREPFNERVFLTTTLVIAIFTIFVFGGLTVPLLKYLKVPMRGHGEPQAASEDTGDSETETRTLEIASLQKSKVMNFDRQVLRPLFIRMSALQTKAAAQREAMNPERDTEMRPMTSHHDGVHAPIKINFNTSDMDEDGQL